MNKAVSSVSAIHRSTTHLVAIAEARPFSLSSSLLRSPKVISTSFPQATPTPTHSSISTPTICRISASSKMTPLSLIVSSRTCRSSPQLRDPRSSVPNRVNRKKTYKIRSHESLSFPLL